MKQKTIVLFLQLASQQIMSGEREPKFQALAPDPPSEICGSGFGSRHPKFLGLRLHSPGLICYRKSIRFIWGNNVCNSLYWWNRFWCLKIFRNFMFQKNSPVSIHLRQFCSAVLLFHPIWTLRLKSMLLKHLEKLECEFKWYFPDVSRDDVSFARNPFGLSYEKVED